MIPPRPVLVAILVGVALAGCASAHTTSNPAPAGPAAAPTAAAGHLPPGPFTIRVLHCGKFTGAERNTLGTTAKGGLVYRYTNNSNTLTGAPNLSVNFTAGSTVVGNNVTANANPIGPRRSATGEVDAVGGSGQALRFTGCDLVSYGIVTSSGQLPGSYAP